MTDVESSMLAKLGISEGKLCKLLVVLSKGSIWTDESLKFSIKDHTGMVYKLTDFLLKSIN